MNKEALYNISNWDVSNVKNMNDMFVWSVSLTNIIINKTFKKHIKDMSINNNTKIIYK